MAIEFKMPQLGESVVEGTISKWLKQEGDTVAEYEPLLEVVTDKVDTEVPSPVDGVLLEIRAAEGETVKVGEVIAVLGEGGQVTAGEPPPSAAEQPTPATAEAPAPAGELQRRPPARAEAGAQAAAATAVGGRPASEPPVGRSYLTPVVARIAAEEDVDLSQVEGTGRHGRITKKDILAYLERRRAVPARAQAPVPAQAPTPAPIPTPTPTPAPEPGVSEVVPEPAAPPAPVAPAVAGGDVEVPLSRMRQATVRHMRQSKDTAAHVTTFWEADLSRVVAHRQAHKARFADEGIKLTFLPYFFQALVAAVKAYPVLNAVLAEDKMIHRRAVNVGMAVDLGDDGLIVPVVKGADERNLRGLARAIDDLATRARARRLDPDDVQGGTITITNHGALGSLAGTPIIPMPQVAIMGVGAIQKRPVVVDTGDGDALAIRPMVYLSLTFDHRAIDGATADRFMAVVKAYLEGYGA